LLFIKTVYFYDNFPTYIYILAFLYFSDKDDVPPADAGFCLPFLVFSNWV